ncbi:MAG: hypothetical protein HRT71_20890 [Flavobacteriales bacterium]|nr:hypothetical protein [Flavobacteriales bacterium]
MNIFSIWDFILGPIYLGIVLVIFRIVKQQNVETNYAYRYFIPGLLAKVGGGLGLVAIYSIVYGNGDTIAYYESAVVLSKLLVTNFDGYVDLMLNGNTTQNWQLFNGEIGWPKWYYYRDPRTFIVCQLYSPLALLSFNSIIAVTIVSATLSFLGVWRLFLTFCEVYPNLTKYFAVAFLFIPSVVFWGSGLLKDTITFSAMCWFVACFYSVFIKKKNILSNVFIGACAVITMLAIKPYIFIAILPGTLIWLFYGKISKIRSAFLRTLVTPIIVIVGISVFSFLILSMGSLLGSYSTQNVLKKAQTTQSDLKRAEYKGHVYDLGEFDGSALGAAEKAPLAILAGLFRPYVWEAGNMVMLLSGLENLFLMMFSIYLIVKIGLYKLFQIIKGSPLLLLCLVFVLFFSFAIGLASANFGSLVRYKIPLIPFFVSALFIIWSTHTEKKMEWETGIEEENEGGTAI